MGENLHIEPDDVLAVAKKVREIADDMPKRLSKARSGVESANSAAASTTPVAYALQRDFATWSDSYDKLTKQVAGFASDLREAVKTWDNIDGANAEVFHRYGKDL